MTCFNSFLHLPLPGPGLAMGLSQPAPGHIQLVADKAADLLR